MSSVFWLFCFLLKTLASQGLTPLPLFRQCQKFPYFFYFMCHLKKKFLNLAHHVLRFARQGGSITLNLSPDFSFPHKEEKNIFDS